jgi:hypothetical protein
MRRLLNDLLARFRTKPTPTRSPAGVDVDLAGVQVEYDPGEVVWTWVPYEDDPSQGKDRPVVVIGRQGAHLVGVPLTSKQHDNEPQVSVGTGPWDRSGRESFAKLERLLCIDADQVRREGAVLDRDRFDAVVAGVQRVRRRR